MCYAIPARIISVTGKTALVDYGGVRKGVNVSLIRGPKPGDCVLVHAGFAIERFSAKDGEESLKLLRELAAAAGQEGLADG